MKIAIVGAGAAGLMCAATIIEQNSTAEVFLIEQNDGLGKKVIISGGGRCNVTTGIQDIRTVLTKYPRGGKFIISAMNAFPPSAVYEWFESHSVPLKNEEDDRVFPISDNGQDIVHAFNTIFQSSRIHVMLKTRVEKITKKSNQFLIFLQNTPEPLICDKLVLTTGGQAYRHTGSTGDGYAFAISLGHTLTKLAPSLNAFFTYENWPMAISGLSFPKATISCRRKKIFSYTGPFLFTHRGVSGPAVFALSSLIAFETYNAKQPLAFFIDLFPDETADALIERLHFVIKFQPKKSILNTIATIIPKSLAEILLQEIKIPIQKHAIEISKKEISACIYWLKAIPLHAIARGAGDEFVTAGGIDTTEVHPKTMESKITPGLYFAGEILDIDGYTGGFNLQASWATGFIAGSNLASH